MSRITHFLLKCAENFSYNIDRAVASLFGAPRQETISSEIGRHHTNPVAEAAEDVLDFIQHDHVKDAITSADRLDAVDKG
jgi:hypothetical protein